MKRLFVLTGLLLACSVSMSAQATRTWVSGVGDDANPCSRTAPCKTFAGAISKTATNGEINVLDPGGFGGVTITKSITISAEGVEAGVLVSGTNAIVINATNTGIVTLRGLDIEGLGTGLAGIKVLSAAAVHVENCTINRFTQVGIDFAPTSASAHTATLFVTNSIIKNNAGASSGGIRIKAGANVTARAQITNTHMSNNTFGLRADATGGAVATNTVVNGGSASGNSGSGLIAVSGGTGNQLMIDGTVASMNGFGIRADAGTVRIANTEVTGNGTGLSTVSGGVLESFGNNRVDGNTIDLNPAPSPISEI